MSIIKENKRGFKVLIAGAFVQLSVGIIYVWSVFVKPVSEFYTWDVESVKLTSSYMLCFFVVGILTGGKLQEKIGASKVVLIGGLMLAFGMTATAFIPENIKWLIYVTYGIIGGFGVGAAYNANITAAQKWFPKNRALATGVSVCTFGFSTVIFAPLIELLLSKFGLRNTFLILSVAFTVVVLALFSFIKLPGADVNISADSAKLLEKRQYDTGEILRTKTFYFILFSKMFAVATFFIVNPSYKILAVDRGLDPAAGTALVMITGIANALGRLGAPMLSDKIGREKAAFTVISLTMLSAVTLCFARGFLFIVPVAVVAFCYGGFAGIYPVITADHFGIKNVGSNYGAVMIGFAVSALFAPMVMSKIPDYTVKFIILAIVAAMGAFCVLLLMLSKKKKQ